ETGRETKRSRVEVDALIIVGLFVAREITADIEHTSGAERPNVIALQRARHAVLIRAGAGVMEIVAGELVFVIPADGDEALVAVAPGVVAASADVGHFVLPAGGGHEIVRVGAGAIAGVVG